MKNILTKIFCKGREHPETTEAPKPESSLDEDIFSLQTKLGELLEKKASQDGIFFSMFQPLGDGDYRKTVGKTSHPLTVDCQDLEVSGISVYYQENSVHGFTENHYIFATDRYKKGFLLKEITEAEYIAELDSILSDIRTYLLRKIDERK